MSLPRFAEYLVACNSASIVFQVPLQDNDCDCGVFLLVFAERFFTDIAPTFECTWEQIKKDFKTVFSKTWFDEDCVRNKRLEMIQVSKEFEVVSGG